MAMLYGAGSQKVQLDELLAAYGDGDFPQNEFDENNDDDNDNYHQLDEALRELAGDNDFTSDSEDFFFQKTRMSRLANFLLLQRPFRPESPPSHCNGTAKTAHSVSFTTSGLIYEKAVN
jgi:hypothetical protein